MATLAGMFDKVGSKIASFYLFKNIVYRKMKSVKCELGWLVRLETGEKLVDSLIRFANKNKIKSAWVQILGAVLDIELGYFSLENKCYEWTKYSETMEVNGCQGNLLKDNSGDLIAHIHGSFSLKTHQTIGGHIKEATTAGTIEILISDIDLDIGRFIDQKTGLKLIDL